MIARTAWSWLVSAKGRTIALITAVALSTALLSLTAIVGSTATHLINHGVRAEYAGADIVVLGGDDQSADDSASGATSTGQGQIPTKMVDRIADLPHVAQATGIIRSQAVARTGDRVTGITIENSPRTLRWQSMVTGRWPSGNDDIAISQQTADTLNVDLGGQVLIGNAGAAPRRLHVVGLVDTAGALTYASASYALVNQATAQRLAGGTGVSEVRVALTPDADPTAAITAINNLSPGGWPLTVDEAAGSVSDLYDSVVAVLQRATAILTAVGILVAVLMLSTMARLSLRSRARTIALMRLVGASRAQVFAAAALESAVIGVTGAVIGLVAAIGVAAIAAWIAGAQDLGVGPEGLSIPFWSALVLPALIAIGVALLAAMPAAVRATRVAPAAAMTAIDTGATRPGPIRLILTLAAALVGVIALANALTSHSVGAVVVASATIGLASLVCSALLAGPWIVRGVSGLLGWLARRLRWPDAALAAANLARDPRRGAAVSSTVMVTMLLCGTALVTVDSARATVRHHIEDQPAVDLVVGDPNTGGLISTTGAQRLAAVPGVVGAVPIITADDVRVTGKAAAIAGTSGSASVPDDASQLSGASDSTTASAQLPIAAMTGEALTAMSNVPFNLHGTMRDDTLYLPTTPYPVFANGSQVQVRGDAGARTLRVVYVDDLPLPAMVTPSTWAALRDQGVRRSVWLRLAPDADRSTVLDQARAEAVIDGDQRVSGTVPVTEKVEAATSMVLLVAALLVLADLIIALIGVAGAFRLAIAERAGENALMRALGLERRQLRAMLLIEATALTSTAALLGGLLGVLTGAVAVHLGGRALDVTPVVVVPGLLLVAIVVVVLCSRLSCSRAADTAARTDVAHALASA